MTSVMNQKYRNMKRMDFFAGEDLALHPRRVVDILYIFLCGDSVMNVKCMLDKTFL